MNLSVFASGDDVFCNCECIKGYAFEMVAPRGKSVHLAHDFVLLRDKSTYSAAVFAQLQDKSVYTTVFNASRHILHMHTS